MRLSFYLGIRNRIEFSFFKVLRGRKGVFGLDFIKFFLEIRKRVFLN